MKKYFVISIALVAGACVAPPPSRIPSGSVSISLGMDTANVEDRLGLPEYVKNAGQTQMWVYANTPYQFVWFYDGQVCDYQKRQRQGR